MNENEKEIEKKRMNILESKLDAEEGVDGKLERERKVMSKREMAVNKIYKYQEKTGEPTDEEADSHFMANNLLNFKDGVSYEELKRNPGDPDEKA